MLMGRAKKKGREIETQQTLKCRDNKDGGVEKEDVARGERALAKRERAANLMAVRSCEKIHVMHIVMC